MIDTVSPRNRYSRVRISPRGSRQASLGMTKFANRISTIQALLVATSRRTQGRVILRRSDSVLMTHHVGAFVTTTRISDSAARKLPDTTTCTATAERTGNKSGECRPLNVGLQPRSLRPNDSQYPITKERQSRARRENCLREVMKEHRHE